MDRNLGITELRALTWKFYKNHARKMPWRRIPADAYHVLVSEMMLQQTQVPRVIPKYELFLKRFPTLDALAQAPLGEVLRTWSGLGYNRRAKYLHDAAGQLAGQPEPWTMGVLLACKGIGFNTAAAVLTYAYNQAVPFIETNVRTVLIHHCFPGKNPVGDQELQPIIDELLPADRPREFMWAMMDYGVYLKSTGGHHGTRSKHYAKQSPFAGSKRQIRGRVLQLLGFSPMSRAELRELIPDKRLAGVLTDLTREGLIHYADSKYRL